MNSDSNHTKIDSCAPSPALDNTQQGQQTQQALFHAQKMHVLGSLVGGMAHDFNNVFTAILLELDLVCQYQPLTDESRQDLERVKESANRGVELVKNLLAFCRAAPCQKRQLQPNEPAREALALLQRTISRKNQITISAPPHLWPILGDQTQICLIIITFCLNSRDAMPNGGTIQIELANEEGSGTGRSGEFVRLTVSDSGTGMPPEVMERLFEPNFTTKKCGKGAGLGLSTVQSMVREHGGWIEVDSKVGHGSQFHVFFPRHVPSPDQTVTPEPLCKASFEGNETVLVAHHDEMMRNLMRAVLAYRGYKILEVNDGLEASDKIASNSEPIHLVVLSMGPPNLDVWGALASIRKQKPALPVILCGGSVDETFQFKAATVGAFSSLPMPFSNPQLLQMVRETLDRRPSP